MKAYWMKFIGGMLPLLLGILTFYPAPWTNAGPLQPVEAVKSFQFESPGLRATLVAAEPLVIDPVALCFDQSGALYVVESRGYPHPGKGLPDIREGKIIKLLDLDGDGLHEKRIVFAANLTFPNGIVPWDDGFFVTDAPDIIYMKDTDGDGAADQRRVVLTGFGTNSSSEQLRVACPTLGPDGWIYVTSGLTGASVTSPLHPGRKPVKLSRNDGRFHPETLEFQALATSGQYGLTFDHHGRRFINANRNPLQYVAFGDDNSAVPQGIKPAIDLAEGRSRLFPLSPDTTAASFIPKLMQDLHAGTFTSACGLEFYNGKRLPQHHGAFFICEPAQNLVHCRFLRETDTEFGSRPSSAGREFLASPDQWFRPVFAATGPDGALYLCDMYRKFIDHPNYLPKEASAGMDFSAGKGHGRIWKITSKSTDTPRLLPEFGGVSRAIREVIGTDIKNKKGRLARLATRSGANEWVRAAILHACADHAPDLFRDLGDKTSPEFIEALAKHLEPSTNANPEWSVTQLFAFYIGLGGKVSEEIARKALLHAGDRSLSDYERVSAIRIAGPVRPDDLLDLVDANEPQAIQDAAIRAIARKIDPGRLLALHPRLGPESRQVLMAAVLGSSRNHGTVLDAIESGSLPLHALTLNQRTRVQKNKAIAGRAKKLFQSPGNTTRQKVFENYRSVLELETNPGRGKPIYQRACAQCHTFGKIGHKVGPDLSGLRNQPAEALLLHILDPNREVYTGFTLYEVETKDGRNFAGILSSGTPQQITLALPLGVNQTLNRSQIKSLKASTLSLMPDGLEQTMSRQELADLLAFLKAEG